MSTVTHKDKKDWSSLVHGSFSDFAHGKETRHGRRAVAKSTVDLRTRARGLSAISVVVLLTALFTSPDILAQTCANDWSAELESAEGDVEARRLGQTDWSPAARGDIFCIGDSIRTQSYGRGLVLLPDETSFRLDQNTTITIVPPQDESRSWLDILRGAIYIISRDPRALGILTPFANAGIEGTEFLVVVTEQNAGITVFEGTVAVTNAAGQVSVSSGQQVSARAGQLPVAQTVVRPRDAVQWTLYYAPVLGQALPGPDDTPSPQRANDPSFYTGRAGARLGVGRVDEANEDIRQALMLDTGNAEAQALQAIIAVTQNDKAEALRLADQAVAGNPNSAAALIAQSYARQASFDVSGALASLQGAVEQEPGNALAWARLSELWLAVGDVDQALQAAEQAVSLNPNIARTQTVLGFAYLTRVDLELATSAFRQAIEYDEAAPLPRLGLGLALIREGELITGRQELKIAVMLDPGNSLVRSYMGKAYYEEKRDDLAESQLDIAKELDPLDPTAFFYDAIRKQTTNRPAEALQDLQRSIDLNDNRAVYRSKLLLDEDSAARSASLARIYRDLGFSRLALVEGWRSVNIEPSDHSGHRLLADVYSAEPRHQIARVNELFKAQLLQPENIVPIQPQLAEANLFILDSAGPSELAFNEFNSLFNTNGFSVQGSGVVGGNDTSGADVVLSGIHDRFSYSIGGYKFETNGFRENNDLEQDVVNAFFQFRPAVRTSIQAELRSSNVEKGELVLLFDPTDFRPTFRQKEEVDSARFGLRHRLNNRSHLLFSALFQDSNFGTDFQPFFVSDTDFDGDVFDLQYLFRGERWHVTSGLTGTDFDRVPSFFQIPGNRLSIKHDTAYVYGNLSIGENVSVILGGSFDSLEGVILDDERFHGKLGLFWNVSPRTTVRFAAFETTQGPLISKQNIIPRLEPTEVAGFNQFFFGPEGEKATRFGAAVDQSFSQKLYAGLEISKREIDFPFQDFTTFPPTPITVDVTEELVRGYLNWLPNDRFAIAAQYQYEDRDNDGVSLTESFVRLTTRRLPLRFSYHNPNGLNLGITATYVSQDIDFLTFPTFTPAEADDTFRTIDASVGYRFKRRRGTVSVAIKNLLDEEFQFQDSDPENPTIFPERLILLKFILAR